MFAYCCCLFTPNLLTPILLLLSIFYLNPLLQTQSTPKKQIPLSLTPSSKPNQPQKSKFLSVRLRRGDPNPGNPSNHPNAANDVLPRRRGFG